MNPRLTKNISHSLQFPENSKCADCALQLEDTGIRNISGAMYGTCKVYKIKPKEILWDGADCPYYIPMGG